MNTGLGESGVGRTGEGPCIAASGLCLSDGGPRTGDGDCEDGVERPCARSRLVFRTAATTTGRAKGAENARKNRNTKDTQQSSVGHATIHLGRRGAE